MSNADEVWLSDDQVDYHRRQFDVPYRSTLALADFARRHLASLEPRTALDVACGAGANIYHLSRRFQKVRWTGLDYAERYLELGRSLIASAPLPHPVVELVTGDLYRLADTLSPASFDVVFSVQTLSWLPRYEEALEQMIAMARPGGWVFVSSLFTDTRVDADIVVRPEGRAPVNYNVYSTSRFERECARHNARLVTAEDFQIDIDLEAPKDGSMGTYTRRLADGTRLQLSGPIWMPWKFLAIKT
jgi:SAM-dependent methyltransferase